MKNSLMLAATLMTCATLSSQAAMVFAEWNSQSGNSAEGTLGGIGVTYSGQVANTTQVGNSGGIQYWTEYANQPLPYSPITGGLPTRTDIIALSDVGTHTITFAQPVLNPVMLICSLGQSTVPVTYDFNQTATVLSSGWSYWNQSTGVAGSLVNSGGDVVIGKEGAGVIGFTGLISSISWTTDNAEYWHGITLAVPEPTTMVAGALLLLPFAAGGLKRIRKNRVA